MTFPFPVLNPRNGNDRFTSLLLHCDGADASTTFTDSSKNALTVTANGNAQIDTAQSVFGGASGLFDGTGDYLSIADNALFEFGSGDFTIEMRARPNSVTGLGTLIDKRATASAFGPFAILRNATDYQVYMSSDGVSFDIANGTSIGTAANNTWSQLAISRSGTSIRLLQNGVVINTVTSSASLVDNATALTIGAIADASVGWTGWIDELCISKGIARYIAAFTPPTFPYS